MREFFSAPVKRTALAAALALATHALLPYLHVHPNPCSPGQCASEARAGQPASSGAGSSSSPDDCPVCSALAHGGARAINAQAPHLLDLVELWLANSPPAAEILAPTSDVEVACARAPPALPRSA